MDLYNLEIAGLSRCEPDPREELRDSVVMGQSLDLTTLRKAKIETLEKTDVLADDLECMMISYFTCQICKCGFMKEGYLKNHMQQKHEQKRN